jgi:tetratricopeptide (TPR) repeat protein
VQQALGNDAGALAQFERAIRSARNCPPPILGNAYLEAARVLERLDRRARALDYYRTAATLFGGAADTHAAAARALDRLER